MPVGLSAPLSQHGRIPAPGALCAWFGDSISDRCAPSALGDWVISLCALYGWMPMNMNLIPNGSFELDATDVANEAGLAGSSLARSTAQHSHGAASLLATGPTTPGQWYFNIGGGPPGSLSCATNASGQIVSAANTTGSGYAGSIIHPVGGSPTTPATLAVAVSGSGAVLGAKVLTGGTGYSGTPTIGFDVNGGGVDGGSNPGGVAPNTPATFTLTMSGTAPNMTVASVTVTGGGTGYTPTPYALIPAAAGPGTGGAICCYLGPGGVIQGGYIAAAGSGYTASTFFAAIVPQMRPASRFYGVDGMRAGRRYALNGKVWCPSGGQPVTTIVWQAVFYDAQGAVSATTGTYLTSGVTNAWQQLAMLSFTVPTTAVAVYLRLLATPTAANQIFYVDDVQLIEVPPGVTAAWPLTYTDWTERGAIAGSPLANVPNQAAGYNGTQLLAAVAGNDLYQAGLDNILNPRTNAGQTTVAARLTKHTGAGVILLLYGINDVRYASSVNGASAITLANIAAGLDAIYAAIAAMPTPPLVIQVGLCQFDTTLMPNQVSGGALMPPPGYATFYDFADAVEAVLQDRAQRNNALYVPVRRRMPVNLVIGPHPIVPFGQQVIVDCIARVIEQGI